MKTTLITIAALLSIYLFRKAILRGLAFIAGGGLSAPVRDWKAIWRATMNIK